MKQVVLGLGCCTLWVCLSGCLSGGARGFRPAPAVHGPGSTAGKQARTTQRSLTQLLALLNRHGHRYGRCGRDLWTGALGAEGALRLKRTYQVTAATPALFGREAHRCAVLRARHRFDRVTMEVNAHDLGLVGTSVKRAVVVAHCRRRPYRCVKVSELGTDSDNKQRWTFRLQGSPEGLRRTALALHRLIRHVKRSPHYRRPHSPKKIARLRRTGRALRAWGIGVTVVGAAGLVVGSVFAARTWPWGPCDGALGGFSCALGSTLAILMVLPGLLTTSVGVGLWAAGASRLSRARELELQAPAKSTSPERPARRRGTPLWTSAAPPISVGWTFRF